MPAGIHPLKCLLMPKSVTVIALLTIKHNKAAKLEYVHIRGEMNSNRYEISFRLKISLRCSVSSLLVFT